MFTPRSSRRFRIPAAVATASALLVTTAARAGSFAINEQSVPMLGTAYAGGAAEANDPSTLFFNPAGMARFQQAQSQSALHYIHPRAEFDNQGSSYGGAFPIRGSDGGGGGRGAIVPNSYYTLPVNLFIPSQRERGSFLNNSVFSNLHVGLALTAPFGLVTSYDPNFVGRYFSLRSKLQTVDISPSLAFTLFDRLHLGIGLDVQYIATRLTSAIDFGLIGFSRGVPGFLPGRQDGVAELYGNDWSVGFNTGAIFEYIQSGKHVGFLDDGRIGVSYRSGITHNLEGDANFRRVPAPFAAVFNNQGITAEAKLPEIYRFSLYQGFARRFAVMGDVTWTRWSRLQNITVNYSNPLTPATVLDLQYGDALRLAGGFTYQPCDALTLRVGYAYDETPIRSAATRTPRIPDSDRHFVSTGFKYSLPTIPLPLVRGFDIDFDFGYAHLFVNDPDINITDNQLHNLVGKYNAHVDIVSASLTFKFGPGAAPERAISPKEEGKTFRK